MAQQWLIRINTQQVPNYAMPPRDGFFFFEPAPVGETPTGKPIGAQGWPECVMEWQEMEGRAFRWWRQWIATGEESVTLTDLVLPNPDTTGSVAGYANHSIWASAELHKIHRTEQAGPATFASGTVDILGPCRLRITNIGKS